MTKTTKIALGGMIFLLSGAAVFRVLTSWQTPQLVSTNLSQPPLAPSSNFSFTFSKPLTKAFVEACTLTTNPEITTSRSSQEKELTFQPATLLPYKTQLSVSLSCPTLRYQVVVQTKSLEELTLQDEQAMQTAKDYDVATAFAELYAEKPWIEKLPLQHEHFALYYSDEKNVYYIYLTPAGAKLNKTQLETEISSALATLGAPQLPLLYR